MKFLVMLVALIATVFLVTFNTGAANLKVNGDDSMIAYSQNTGSGEHHIFVITADGSSQFELTRASGEYEMPCWSTDKKYVYFSGKRSGDPFFHIWRAELHGNGAEMKDVTPLETVNCHAPSVNQRGEILMQKGPGAQVYTVINGGIRLAPGAAVLPKWSSDGEYYVGNVAKMMFLTDMNTRERILLRQGEAPSMSRDQHIVFHYLKGNELTLAVGEIKSNPYRIESVHDLCKGTHGTWNSAGTQIAFHSDDEGKDEIYVVNADGSGRRRVAKLDYPGAYPAWH